MFPRRAFLATGHGWRGYEETPEERAQGGLLPEDEKTPSVPEDNGTVKPMEEDASDEQSKAAPEEEEIPAWPFPPVIPLQNPLVVSVPGNGSQVFCPIALVPPGLLGMPPQLLKALPKVDPELLEKQCAAVCFRSILPSVVCESPLMILLSSASACAAMIKIERPVSEAIPPTHERFTSLMQSALRLQQWKAAVLECVPSFHETMRPRDIWNAGRAYQRELTSWEDQQNAELEELYRSGASLQDHAIAWERHGVEYLHLLERFLYECLVSRIPDAPPLDQLLTPFYFAAAEECSPALKKQERDDIIKFFKFKYERSPKDGLAEARFFDQTPEGAPMVPLWRGWFSYSYLATYHEYLRDSEFAPPSSSQ